MELDKIIFEVPLNSEIQGLSVLPSQILKLKYTLFCVTLKQFLLPSSPHEYLINTPPFFSLSAF